MRYFKYCFWIFEFCEQLLKTQQDCVDTYLEDCILSTQEEVADNEARVEIQEKANMINDLAYEVEEK